MKSIRILCCTLAASAAIHAQDSTIEQIVEKRDALLTQIHESTKNSFAVGAASQEQVRSAALDLYSFRRDSAKTLTERLKWQEEIIASEKQQKASVEKRMTQGTAAPVDGLRAAERVLAAEQKLLEFKTVK